MPASTNIAVSWETKDRLLEIASEISRERAARKERGRRVTMDDAVTRALDAYFS